MLIRHLIGGFAEMPFSRHQGPIPDLPKSIRQSEHSGLQGHRISGLPLVFLGQDFRNRRHARAMRIDAGQQHGPRRRTKWRGSILKEFCAVRRERVDIGGLRFSAIGAEIHEPGIIDQNDHDVRSIIRLRSRTKTQKQAKRRERQ